MRVVRVIFFFSFLETDVKRACADVTLKMVDDDDISGFLLWSREYGVGER